jgi:hypothetical protein
VDAKHTRTGVEPVRTPPNNTIELRIVLLVPFAKHHFKHIITLAVVYRRVAIYGTFALSYGLRTIAHREYHIRESHIVIVVVLHIDKEPLTLF